MNLNDNLKGVHLVINFTNTSFNRLFCLFPVLSTLQQCKSSELLLFNQLNHFLFSEDLEEFSEAG